MLERVVCLLVGFSCLLFIIHSVYLPAKHFRFLLCLAGFLEYQQSALMVKLVSAGQNEMWP